ncbi:dephospho-CoA kinase [Devosia sp.]|uniref:dephospho-CoA kinase n=1 Tax=Devosia sp. TaxID=1871048 RepID=UPI003A8F6E4E
MFRLGLTGSIATGKSTVLAAFADHGVPTFSADAAVHRLYRGAAVAPVEAAFPGVAHDGKIDRQALSAQLLEDPDRLAELEEIVHPLVRAEITAFLDTAEAEGAELAVVDIPLLYENGVDWGFDAVVVTRVDPQIQRERVLARPGMTVEKLEAILARQMPQAEKEARADHVLDTGKPIADTRAEVADLLARLRPQHAGRDGGT